MAGGHKSRSRPANSIERKIITVLLWGRWHTYEMTSQPSVLKMFHLFRLRQPTTFFFCEPTSRVDHPTPWPMRKCDDAMHRRVEAELANTVVNN